MGCVEACLYAATCAALRDAADGACGAGPTQVPVRCCGHVILSIFSRYSDTSANSAMDIVPCCGKFQNKICLRGM